VTVLLNSTAAAATEKSISFRLSVGNSWQTRNDVQIRNSELGSRFSLAEAVGEGPITTVRLDVSWMLNEKHRLRVLLAPLSYTESVTFDEPVLFAGGSSNPDQQTDASYTLGADFDGLAGGLGRAIDLGVGIDYSISGKWKLGAVMRILDGGADVDEFTILHDLTPLLSLLAMGSDT